MSDFWYFPNNLKDRKDLHDRFIGLHDRLQNLFPINGNSFLKDVLNL